MANPARRAKDERAMDDPFFGYLFAKESDLLESFSQAPIKTLETNEKVSTLVCLLPEPSSTVTNLIMYRPMSSVTELTLLGQMTALEGCATVGVGELRDSVESLSRLAANWDDEGAQAISQDTLRTASRIIEHIAIVLERKNTSSTPRILPFPDGTVVFKWVHGSKELNITVDANNVTAQRWQPLDAYHSLGLWPMSVDDTSEQVEWVLS